MLKNRIITGLAILLTLVSCGQEDGGGSVQYTGNLPEILQTVPSDALAVICTEKCSRAMGLLDSAHVLRSIDYGRLKNADAALSWSYNGSLVPVLAIDTGKNQADTSSAAASILSQAARLRLYSEYYRPDRESGRNGYIILTTSEAELTAVRRHISEGRSILDAQDFETAARQAGGSGDFAVARCNGAARLVPRDFLTDIFQRRPLISFLHSMSDWITAVPAGHGEYIIRPTRKENDTYFTNILASLPASDSRLGTMLPPDTEFALSIPAPQPEFREAFERYQDASVRMTGYTRRLSELEKNTRKNPLKWEKELDIREIALLRRDGEQIVLLRPAKYPGDKGPSDNPYRGFIQALYGSAFALDDDSCTACCNGWMVTGSRRAVESFAECEERMEIKWPARNCRIAIYWHSNLMCWDKKEIRIWNSSQLTNSSSRASGNTGKGMLSQTIRERP